MKKAILVASVFMALATVGCDKNDDDDAPVTAAQIITSASWNIDTIAFDMNKDGTIDAPVTGGGLGPCELDNTLTFNSDSTGVFDEGASKCDTADPQSINFTWQLKGNDSILNINGNLPGELKGDIRILTLSNNSFILSKNLTSTFPVPYDFNLIVSLQK